MRQKTLALAALMAATMIASLTRPAMATEWWTLTRDHGTTSTPLTICRNDMGSPADMARDERDIGGQDSYITENGDEINVHYGEYVAHYYRAYEACQRQAQRNAAEAKAWDKYR